MKLRVKSKTSGKYIYLRDSSLTIADLRRSIGSNKFSVRDENFTIEDIEAVRDGSVYRLAAIGFFVGIIAGPIGAFVGGIIGMAIGYREEKLDQYRIDFFYRHQI